MRCHLGEGGSIGTVDHVPGNGRTVGELTHVPEEDRDVVEVGRHGHIGDRELIVDQELLGR